ncbi:MAG: hypothetical protein V9E94_19460 [Microthrixaceae bacterium]
MRIRLKLTAARLGRFPAGFERDDSKETLTRHEDQSLADSDTDPGIAYEEEGSSILSRVPTDHVQTVRLQRPPGSKTAGNYRADECSLVQVLKIDDVLPVDSDGVVPDLPAGGSWTGADEECEHRPADRPGFKIAEGE